MLIALKGNTYPVKDQLKALGAKWSTDARHWLIDDRKEAEANAIIASAGPAPARNTKPPMSYRGQSRMYVCSECGERVRTGTRCWESGATH